MPESCTGTGNNCPADGKEPATTTCRQANGECDAPESCDGQNNNCPTDVFDPDGTACTSDQYQCTQDVCENGQCIHDSELCTCTRTIGYWKTHPEAWPVTSIMIGEDTLTKAQAINVLNNANSKDTTYMLAAQLIAAKLNLIAFTSNCAAIGPANTFFNGAIDIGTNLSKAQKTQATTLITQLDTCNNSGEAFCKGNNTQALAIAENEDTADAVPAPMDAAGDNAEGGCSLATSNRTMPIGNGFLFLMALGLLPLMKLRVARALKRKP